jgi:acetyltransferase-like isoleucine patch superfamily enzyme
MLQVDQYNHWRRGYIEDHVYRLWLYDRHAEFMANHSIGGVPYRAGWETAKATTIRDKAFLDHMTYVSDGQIDKR